MSLLSMILPSLDELKTFVLVSLLDTHRKLWASLRAGTQWAMKDYPPVSQAGLWKGLCICPDWQCLVSCRHTLSWMSVFCEDHKAKTHHQTASGCKWELLSLNPHPESTGSAACTDHLQQRTATCPKLWICYICKGFIHNFLANACST